MSFDALKELAAAGHNFKGANPQQLEAVASLSQEEVTLLNSIKQRLDSAEDVVPHGVDAPLSGAFVW
ncbi:aroma-sacti cluster domain-containing protein [Streptomyces sp. NPDC005962]|uniref:aroma-sacti cluster domain-containing protein n=1 Tax=Streptomyces sp. NPDC005962 TaxID=3154466 RepID=UPI0033D20B4D